MASANNIPPIPHSQPTFAGAVKNEDCGSATRRKKAGVSLRKDNFVGPGISQGAPLNTHHPRSARASRTSQNSSRATPPLSTGDRVVLHLFTKKNDDKKATHEHFDNKSSNYLFGPAAPRIIISYGCPPPNRIRD